MISQWERLKTLAFKSGLKVELVSSRYLHDFIGMNPLAAKELGFRMPANKIWILKTLSAETQLHTLRHELIEYHHMMKGDKYFQAHVFALEHEK